MLFIVIDITIPLRSDVFFDYGDDDVPDGVVVEVVVVGYGVVG